MRDRDHIDKLGLRMCTREDDDRKHSVWLGQEVETLTKGFLKLI